MPRDGSGNFSLSEPPFVFDTVISETAVNNNFSDIANALTASIAKDGQTTPTANLPMGGYKHTNINTSAGSSSRSEYVAAAVAQDGAIWDAGSTSGTSTAYTATLSPSITAYADKQCFRVKLDQACGVDPTINFNSVGAKKIYLFEGTAPAQPAAGELLSGDVLELRYDASLDSGDGGFLVINKGPRATQVAAEAGTDNSTYMTPLRTKQAIVMAVPPGAVMAFAMPSAPSGWLEADGSAVARATYADLDTAIYVGNSDNATALFGYRCTDPMNPSTSRDVDGDYIVLPDLRGEFIRGWDNGRGVDAGRALGSSQSDEFRSHYHVTGVSTFGVSGGTAAGVADNMGTNKFYNSTATGGNETRPRNIALMYCIKF